VLSWSQYWNILEYLEVPSVCNHQKKNKKNICKSWVVLRCFEYASTSTINPPSTINPVQRSQLQKGGLGDRAPVRLVGAEPQKTSTWLVSERRLWNGKLSKSEQKNYSALTSLFADYGFKYHYWLVVCNIWIMTFHILGMSSSQLTNSYFSEG